MKTFGLASYIPSNDSSPRISTNWSKRQTERKPFGLRSNVKRGTKPVHQPFSLVRVAESDEEPVQTLWSKRGS